jgi:hypothetical protein
MNRKASNRSCGNLAQSKKVVPTAIAPASANQATLITDLRSAG